MKTEAWWVCHKCGQRVVQPKKKNAPEKKREHNLICDGVGYRIEQLPQGKGD